MKLLYSGMRLGCPRELWGCVGWSGPVGAARLAARGQDRCSDPDERIPAPLRMFVRKPQRDTDSRAACDLVRRWRPRSVCG